MSIKFQPLDGKSIHEFLDNFYIDDSHLWAITIEPFFPNLGDMRLTDKQWSKIGENRENPKHEQFFQITVVKEKYKGHPDSRKSTGRIGMLSHAILTLNEWTHIHLHHQWKKRDVLIQFRDIQGLLMYNDSFNYWLWSTLDAIYTHEGQKLKHEKYLFPFLENLHANIEEFYVSESSIRTTFRRLIVALDHVVNQIELNNRIRLLVEDMEK